MFATHYHSLLEDWKDQPSVRLGHMECFVEDEVDENDSNNQNDEEKTRDNITFLYTLGEGSCPKSFGINVARLAGLPSDVLNKARNVSSLFEDSLKHKVQDTTMTRSELLKFQARLVEALKENNVKEMDKIWEHFHS